MTDTKAWPNATRKEPTDVTMQFIAVLEAMIRSGVLDCRDNGFLEDGPDPDPADHREIETQEWKAAA
jgi:hypothetical protein